MDNNTTSGYGTTNDSQGFRQSNVSHPPPYPVSNVDNRPKDTTYPPVSQAYPPVSSAYPDPSAGNLPPSTAPPPYTAIYPPQTTSVSNNTTVVINEPPASRYVNDYTTQVGFNSKTIRLGESV